MIGQKTSSLKHSTNCNPKTYSSTSNPTPINLSQCIITSSITKPVYLCSGKCNDVLSADQSLKQLFIPKQSENVRPLGTMLYRVHLNIIRAPEDTVNSKCVFLLGQHSFLQLCLFWGVPCLPAQRILNQVHRSGQ